MYSVASSTATLGTAFSDTGTLVAYVLLAVVGGVIALMGLGFGIRHLRKYITGKKF